MKKRIKAAIAVAVAVVIGTGGFITYRHIKSKGNIPSMARMDQTTSKVQKSSFTDTITASGSVLLDDEVEVYAEGEVNIVRKILVEEGDTVSAGDLIVEYDVDDSKEELENKVRDTKREIENAELSLESMTAKASDSELTKLKSAITSKEKSLQEAKTTYESYTTKLNQQQNTIDNAQQDVDDAEKELSDTQTLLEIGGATQSEYDTAKTTLDKAEKTLSEAKEAYNDLVTEQNNAKLSITTAENDLTDAENEYKDAQNPLSTEDAQIQYKQQQLTLQGLKDNLSDYEKDLSELVYYTYADVSGKVTEVCIDEGTYTEENTVILKVADFNKLVVSASIEEYDAPLVAVGQKVIMTSDGLEGKEYTGTVTEVNDIAEAATTTMGSETAVPIEISVDNPDGVLKPGYNLDLEITVVDKQNVLTVPVGAVQTDAKEGVKYVYVIDGGIINKREVTTGETNDTEIEIVSGVNEGDEIITNPSGEISENMTLDEYKKQLEESNASSESENGGEAEGENLGNMMNGGMGNDQNRGANQGVQSGGPRGGGPGGGGPMG